MEKRTPPPRKTKIVCTIGPASFNKEMLKKLIQAGLDVARLNCSHGTHKILKQVIEDIRSLSRDLGKHIGILLDLAGPKIRVGEFEEGAIPLVEGEKVTLTTRQVTGEKGLIPVNYSRLGDDVKIGENILFDDGLLRVQVTSIQGTEIETEIKVGGTLKNRKGLNLPGTVLSIPALTPKDLDDLQFGLKEDVDFVALSFVRHGKDVLQLREIINKNNSYAQIISKIEKPAALDNIEEIIAYSDGIMVARGDLGVEIQASRVPGIQKDLIRLCNEKNIPVITATQMLESMIVNPVPTRAEATDVANAIYDGTDAVMLSGETASGKYPVEAVKMMAEIAVETEKSIFGRGLAIRAKQTGEHSIRESIARASSRLSTEINAGAIVVYSQAGPTAIMVSKYKNAIPILGITPNPNALRRMCLYWGVIPVLIDHPINTEDVVQFTEKVCQGFPFLEAEDTIIMTTGVPIGISGTTNAIKIHILPKDFRKKKIKL